MDTTARRGSTRVSNDGAGFAGAGAGEDNLLFFCNKGNIIGSRTIGDSLFHHRRVKSNTL